MTREEIINGLKMSIDLMLFDPTTGEVKEPHQLNDMDRTSYEAFKGAMEILAQPDVPDTNVGDTISRQAAIDAFWKLDIELRPSAIDAITDMLKTLQYAQPDLSAYSDKLWRSAYERGKAEARMSTMIDLYVKDRHSGRIHRVGDDQHDQLTIDGDGQLRYYNLQCGEGCSTKRDPRDGYEFVPNTDEYGYNMDPREEEKDG